MMKMENYDEEMMKKKKKKKKPALTLNNQEKEDALLKMRQFNRNNLTIRNVINSTSGKEFTLKITPEILMKCLKKHSGGPKVKAEEKAMIQNDDGEEFDGLLRLTTLLDEHGNSVLHRAVACNQLEFVNYFLEKGIIIYI